VLPSPTLRENDGQGPNLAWGEEGGGRKPAPEKDTTVPARGKGTPKVSVSLWTKKGEQPRKEGKGSPDSGKEGGENYPGRKKKNIFLKKGNGDPTINTKSDKTRGNSLTIGGGGKRGRPLRNYRKKAIGQTQVLSLQERALHRLNGPPP